MSRLVECVPNFSEGRRTHVVDAIAEAVTRTPGAHLLDRTSDVDHNRSVLTFAGEEAAVTDAMEDAMAAAIARIDMTTHEGRHPRLGAIDVVPFVPLGETTLDECVEIARRFGAHMADHFDLPVYLYAAAATRPERRVLADIRRPQFEGLAAMMAAPGGEPDFGPPTPHPSAGAVVIGARPFLVAWNINLETTDVALAKRIAGAVRERDGGLPRVQALGLFLDDLGVAQVSMNLLDTAITPMWRVWEAVEALAAEAGVGLRESELIGLAPQMAILAAADHAGVPATTALEERLAAGAAAIRIRDFTPDMALELRLAAASR
ncbi:MAG: glutamate formimidoyltransferase [Chloroflexota bacterium]